MLRGDVTKFLFFLLLIQRFVMLQEQNSSSNSDAKASIKEVAVSRRTDSFGCLESLLIRMQTDLVTRVLPNGLATGEVEIVHLIRFGLALSPS